MVSLHFRNVTYVNNFCLGWRSRSELNRRRYGHLRGARLESDEGPAGDGSGTPHRTEEGRQRLPPCHQGHAGGEDYGVSILYNLKGRIVVSNQNTVCLYVCKVNYNGDICYVHSVVKRIFCVQCLCC